MLLFRYLSVSKVCRNALFYGISVQKFWTERNKEVGSIMPLQCGLLNLCTLAICASIGWEQFMKFSDTLMSAAVTFS